MKDLRILLLPIFLLSIFVGLAGCSLFNSPIQLERQALHHANKALDHANRLIPLLQVGSWEPAYKRAGSLKGELEETNNLLDRALKRWALGGQSPLSWELDSLDILNDVADSNGYIQDKLSQQLSGQAEITTSAQNGKAIDKHLAPPEEGV